MKLILITFFLLAATYFVIAFIKWRRNRRRMVELAERLPGPSQTNFALLEVAALMHSFQQIAQRYRINSYVLTYSAIIAMTKTALDEGILRFWLGFKPLVLLYKPETIEPILTSLKVLNKSDLYAVFEPWIGEGLVTSKRTKWQFRRKILTPAFHFRILNDFLPIMNEEATKFVKKLNQIKYSGNCRVNIVPLVALCTLDTICETAMGAKLDNQTKEEESPYVRALYTVAEMALARVSRPWLWNDMAYYRTQFGKRFDKARDLMHEFTMSIIKERKQEWEEIIKDLAEEKSNKTDDDRDESTGASLGETLELQYAQRTDKRMAFLDLLLHRHLIEKDVSLDDIREEVDTFMFAGHDTTAMNIDWTLYMLGLYPEIQDKVRAEIDRVLDKEEPLDDKDLWGCLAKEDNEDEHPTSSEQHISAKKLKTSNITTRHLRELKYLDQCIKEALRMWPSIPFVARQMTEDVKVGANGEYTIPEGATSVIFTHALHNNPRIYPKPEVYDPERFNPEAVAKRHPFAFVPFSAGPRNCIGQKFAQMEVKIILAKLLRNYYFESCEPIDKLHVVGELVLRTIDGLYMRIRPRFV